MAHRIKKMKVSELIEDFSIYPRNCVFDGHVYDLAEALRSGAALPPVVADRKTLCLTDGFHRRRATEKVGGSDAQIDVMLVTYADKAAMAEDAMVRNATHGRRLTTADIARCAALAEHFHISRERLSSILNVTRNKLDDITARRTGHTSSGETVVLRRPMEHLAAKKTLTPAQEKIVSKVGGLTAYQHASRLVDLIESESLPDDGRLFEKLKQLHELLESLLVAA